MLNSPYLLQATWQKLSGMTVRFPIQTEQRSKLISTTNGQSINLIGGTIMASAYIDISTSASRISHRRGRQSIISSIDRQSEEFMAVLTYMKQIQELTPTSQAQPQFRAYTSTGDKPVMCDVSIDAVAGNGDYGCTSRGKMAALVRLRILPQTTMAAASA